MKKQLYIWIIIILGTGSLFGLEKNWISDFRSGFPVKNYNTQNESEETVKNTIFTPMKKGGLVLIASGGTLFTSGFIIFAVQMGYLNPLVQAMKSEDTEDVTYTEYQRNAVANTSLFILSISFISVGTILLCAGIPLLVIPMGKKNQSAMVMKLRYGGNSVALDWTISLPQTTKVAKRQSN